MGNQIAAHRQVPPTVQGNKIASEQRVGAAMLSHLCSNKSSDNSTANMVAVADLHSTRLAPVIS